MMKRKEIIKNVLIIFCVIILLIIPWASVIGIQDPGLLGAAGEFQRTAGFVLITAMVLHLIYQIYGKPLTQEMKEEEIKEAYQKDRKQMLFKPTISAIIFFLVLILLGIGMFIHGIFWIFFLEPNEDVLDVFAWIIGSFFLIVFFTWGWYGMPVFIFTEDSVQIRSHLLYLLGIDRNTVFRYVDITSVSPDAKMNGTYGVEPMHRMMITSKGTTQAYGLICYNPDIIAKIYLRFREKLGDKVRLE